VFFVNGSKDVDMLITRLGVDYLSIPSFKYASIISICKRTWKDISKYNLATITSELEISSKHYNSLEDAISMGLIINKALEYHQASDIEDLFSKIGFAGGYVFSGQKVVYRARKDKKSKQYYQKIDDKYLETTE
jgi:DNA polymerase III epsilon subunit-like protein